VTVIWIFEERQAAEGGAAESLRGQRCFEEQRGC